MAQILPKNGFQPEKVKVYGHGIEPNSVVVGEKTSFTVDTSAAGSAPLDIKVNI